MAAAEPAGPAPTTTAFLPLYRGVTGGAASGAGAGADVGALLVAVRTKRWGRLVWCTGINLHEQASTREVSECDDGSCFSRRPAAFGVVCFIHAQWGGQAGAGCVVPPAWHAAGTTSCERHGSRGSMGSWWALLSLLYFHFVLVIWICTSKST